MTISVFCIFHHMRIILEPHQTARHCLWSWKYHARGLIWATCLINTTYYETFKIAHKTSCWLRSTLHVFNAYICQFLIYKKIAQIINTLMYYQHHPTHAKKHQGTKFMACIQLSLFVMCVRRQVFSTYWKFTKSSYYCAFKALHHKKKVMGRRSATMWRATYNHCCQRQERRLTSRCTYVVVMSWRLNHHVDIMTWKGGHAKLSSYTLLRSFFLFFFLGPVTIPLHIYDL